MPVIPVHTAVYTSSQKVEDMVLQEDRFLNLLHVDVLSLGCGHTLLKFSDFYVKRMAKFKERRHEIEKERLKHPNEVFHTIKQFVSAYQEMRDLLEPKQSLSIQKRLSLVADQSDIIGAKKSFFRLQVSETANGLLKLLQLSIALQLLEPTVYNLSALDMATGNYLGYMGAPLTVLEAYDIAQIAFNEGRLNTTIEWLGAARALQELLLSDDLNDEQLSEGQIDSLLGRVEIRKGNDDVAFALYNTAKLSDPLAQDVSELERELVSKPRLADRPHDMESSKLYRLCASNYNLIAPMFDIRIRCTYRPMFVPYYRIKHEQISVSPYVCLFHDVLTDTESEYLKEFVRYELERGSVVLPQGLGNTEGRTSDIKFLYDFESETVARVARRISALTHLNATQSPDNLLFSGEPFQVVNYGMGGHYKSHMDTFDTRHNDYTWNNLELNGNRLATFLIYLSDVDRGGSTAFPQAGIVVRPVKNMALFWYSLKPSGEEDRKTVHAGCPVTVGHKWVTNKWIWTYGNTFTRRCGRTPDATQMDIEEHMSQGWL